MRSGNVTSREIERFPSTGRKDARGLTEPAPWIRLVAGVMLVFAARAGIADAAAPATFQDSVRILIPEVPLDSLLQRYGDLLFVPPEGNARILRDRYGVPHIYGKRDVDVAFGFGYAQAQDHLVPMLLNYRAAAGTASEVLGAGHLDGDERALLWRIRSVAVAGYGALPPETRNLIGAFADGVNHYIDVYRDELPDWVAHVGGTDVVALSRWLVMLFAEQAGRPELAKIGLTPFLGTRSTSNTWVLGGSRTAAGIPVFGMDLHLPWRAPFQPYEAHLVSREGLDVSGVTLFGIPVILAGHNRHIAWSLAANEADVFDLYELKLDPANRKRYVFQKEKRRMSSRRVRIRVRDPRGIREVGRELLYSHFGPIYKAGDDRAYAGRCSAEEVVNVVGQLYAVNRAGDPDAFESALRKLQLPMFHVLYGDAAGRLLYVYSARSPVRAGEFDWRSPVPGWIPDTEWRGNLGYERLPRIMNPRSDFLQNCNVAPEFVTHDSGLRQTDFPPFMGWGGLDDRGQRLLTWLSANTKATLRQLKELTRDPYLIAAEETKGFVFRAYNRSWWEIYDPDRQLAHAVELLRSWDNRASVESRATLLFSIWKSRFTELVSGVLPEQASRVAVLDKLALEALRMAVEQMTTTYGRLDVPWGEVHVIERGGSPYPVGGSAPGTQALHTTWSKPGEDGLYRVDGGSAYTMVVELADTLRSWSLQSLGNSENPESDNHHDQAAMQATGELKRFRLSHDAVRADLRSVVTVPLEPGDIDREQFRIRWKLKSASKETAEPEPEDGGG
ncbi:MAG: penicillin acylase family protein [Gemmatimonadota bacterium]|nr:penicillin acylase family protein [Gemmatimonadota bacterium]